MIKKTITKKIKCPQCGNVLEIHGIKGEKKIITCPKCQLKGSFTFTQEKPEKKEILTIFQPAFFIIIIPIVVSYFIFYNHDFGTLLSFIALVPIYVHFKLDGRIPIAYALFMILLSIIIYVSINDENLSNLLVIYSFWLLTVGGLCLSIGYIRESKA